MLSRARKQFFVKILQGTIPWRIAFLLPWSQSFLWDKREKEAARENLWLQAMRISLSYYNRCHKQPIATHLLVNTSQSEYAYKVPPIRRQSQILTLVQINCCGQPEVYSPLPLSLLFSLLRGSSLRKPLAPRVPSCVNVLLIQSNLY